MGMPTGMYKSIYGRGKEPLWKSHKGQTALALAVSLWIAGGGVARAGQQIVNDDTTISDNQSANFYDLQEGVTFTVEGPDGQVQYITGTGSNTINILNGGVVNNDGITSISGGDRNNIVNIGKDSKLDGIVYGGYTNSGTATKNEVTISGGEVKGYIYGGYAKHEASDNKVTISGGKVGDYVYGGYSTSKATSNQVIISGGIVGKYVYGGYSTSKATKNQVIISGSDTNVSLVYGGYAEEASDNVVTIKDGTFGRVYGAYAGNNATKNQVIISGGTMIEKVCGGYSVASGQCTENVVTITGGTFNGNVYGGLSISGSATGNTVNLGGATLNKSLFGGAVEIGDGDTFTNNVLNLSGTSTVAENVANFEKITLDKELAWDTTVPVLTAASYENIGGLDITAATKLNAATTPGTMTLLSSGTENNFDNLNLTYKNGTTNSTVTLNDTNKSQVVKTGKDESSTVDGVTIGYNNTHTVKLDDVGGTTKNAVTYNITNNINKITLGEIAWVKDCTVRSGTGYTINSYFSTNDQVDVSNFKLKFANETAYKDMYHQTMTLIDGVTFLYGGVDGSHTQSLDYTVSNGANITTNITTDISSTGNKVNCYIGWVGIRNIDLANWDSTKEKFVVPEKWKRYGNWGSNPVTVAADFATADIAPGTTKEIVDASNYGADFFSDANISGTQKYKAYTSSSDTASGVTLTGSESKGVQAAEDGKKLVYARSDFNVNSISFGEMEWGGDKGRTAAEHYDYSNVTDANIDVSGLTFKNPEDIDPGYTVSTLLAANETLTATLAGVNKNTVSYSYSPASGVTVDGKITGSISKIGDNICYQATGNKADKLTFGNVEWKDTGALMERPSNISFTEAAVDTSNINFTNIKELDANKQMTLVSNIGERVGSITGTKYKVGSTMQGEGSASIEDNHLVFKTSTAAEKMELQEQTHNTVMMEEVDLEALSTGDEFIAEAERGLALVANTGADGIASFATMGGGSVRQETGSHVDTHTWNAILAIGRKNDKEKASFEYGGFFEYGRGNYTTHNGDERGDGSMHYAGGGVLAKWQKKDGFYVEGSLRMGNVHEDAKNVLRDAAGVPYSYDTDAPYWGVHVGAGKEITLKNGNSIDVYGKYFFNRRDGVSFDAGGHYDLDAITSQIVSVGARYNVKREKWNFYGGLAYEHELDGKASGKADGMPIRGADTSGGSLRAEIGTVLQPDKNLPWKIDLNLSTYAGKKRGFTGGVSVALMF